MLLRLIEKSSKAFEGDEQFKANGLKQTDTWHNGYGITQS